MRARTLAPLGLAVALVAAGCGKPPAPVADAEKERKEAAERAKQRAYGGDAVKALETAQGLQADLNKKVEETIEKNEK